MRVGPRGQFGARMSFSFIRLFRRHFHWMSLLTPVYQLLMDATAIGLPEGRVMYQLVLIFLFYIF